MYCTCCIVCRLLGSSGVGVAHLARTYSGKMLYMAQLVSQNCGLLSILSY